jgi:hypothetical protein
MLSRNDDIKQQHLIGECICIEFTVPRGKEQVIFTSDGIERLFASGFISYDDGIPQYITVRFYDGYNQVGNGIQVFQNSSIGFTHTGFNRISVTSPSSRNGSMETEGIGSLNTCEGEICLKIKITS